MRRLLVIIPVFLCTAGSLAALDVRVRVYDPQENKAIPDATVIVLETRQKYYTDGSGTAVVTLPDAGFYTFRAIAPGYGILQPRLQATFENQLLTIFTSAPNEEKPDTGGTQIVTDQGIQVRGKEEKQNLSRYNVRLDEVKRIPGQFGEALRGVENLPGVNAPPFGNGDIVLRGANENANTYLLDELPVGYPFHLLGLNSVVQNDIIKSIDIYTGAYPVNFGDATGGVIAIETVDEVEKFGGHTTFTLWSASVLFKAPFGEDSDKGYWIAGGRASYLDQTLKAYIPSGFTLIPKYQDGQLKVRYNLNPQNTIYFYAYGSKDSLIAKIDDRPTWDPTTEPPPEFVGASVALDRVFHTEAIRHVYRSSAAFELDTRVFYHNNIAFTDGTLGVIDINQKLEDGYASVRTEATAEVLANYIYFDAGLEARQFRYRYNGIAARNTDPADQRTDLFDSNDATNIFVNDSSDALYTSGYGMLTLKYGWLEAKPGARVDYFGPTKQRVIDPRGTLALRFPTDTTITGGAGIYHRVPDPQQYSETSGNPDLRMESAEHVAVGIEQLLGNWSFRVEAFRQIYKDIVVEDIYAQTPVRLNQNPLTRYQEPVLYNQPLFFSNDGTGWSDGFEILIRLNKPEKKNGFYGWLTYTWSRSLRNDHQYVPEPGTNPVYSAEEKRILAFLDNSREIYADFDRRNIINLIIGYKVNREWQIGVRWRYTTSRPFTEITGDDGGVRENNGRPIFDPVYSQRTNELRLKPYHRLDIRIDRFFNYEWGYGNVFFEALNLYLRDNPGGYAWDSSQPFSATNPSITPEFGNIVVPTGDGQGLRVPLFNIGVEVKF